MIDQGQITAGHGKAILRITDENLQIELANKVIAEELSVRATENLAKKISEENIKEIPKKVKEKDVFIVDVEERLRNIFGTKVNISRGKKKGKIEIEYYNEDELNNIVSMLLEDN
jgi:ParB family chromosome partitioning protein